MSKRGNDHWEKLSSLLTRSTSNAAIIIIALAAASELSIQIGAQGVYPALLGFLSSLFGDAVAGPLISYFSAYNDEQYEDLIVQFEKALNQDDIRRDVAELLSKHDILAGTLGTALQYQQQEIVRLILTGVANYQEFHTRHIIEQMQRHIGQLDPETRYLTGLIYKLQKQDGLSEYVDMRGKVWLQESDLGKREVIDRKLVDPIFAVKRYRPRDTQVTSSSVAKQEITLETVLEAAKKFLRFVLIGDPGSGKTTTLRRLALDAAWKRMSNPKAPIPLFKELQKWKAGNLDDFVSQNWKLDLSLPEALIGGDVVLYLDGLNEMGASGYIKANKLKEWLHGKNHPQYTIIACRAKDHKSLDLNITTVHIDPLDKDKIKTFVTNYLGDEANMFLNYLRADEEHTTPHLFNLASNPFMLRALLIIYEDSSELPSNRFAVIQSLVAYLWDREEKRNTKGWITYEEMLDGFSSLAFNMLRDGQTTTIPLTYAIKHVPLTNLQVADSANVIKIDDEQISFFNQSIQEYFVVEYYILNYQDSALAELMQNATNMAWWEVFLLVVGMLDNTDVFFNSFISRLNEMAIEDGKLMSILQWIDMKANQLQSNYGGATKRCYYLFFTLDLIQVSALDLLLALGDSPYSLARALAVELDDLDYFYEVILGYHGDFFESDLYMYVENQHPNRPRSLAFDLVNFDELESGIQLDLFLDLALDPNSIHDFVRNFNLGLNFSEELGLFKLKEALQSISTPKINSSKKEWSKFSETIQKIILEHRQLRYDWQFTADEAQHLIDYLAATQLLVDCLKMADTANRSNIVNQLLLPPRPH